MNWVYLRGHHRITPGQSRDKKLRQEPLKDNLSDTTARRSKTGCITPFVRRILAAVQ
jgi:hypothetical protein